ncbi:MAG: hypothetical protein DWI24_11205 [Planctomycetota bacterium]|nr:MAG: hypothetical protein DWI24_11205 [Planctomycetota bacterium]
MATIGFFFSNWESSDHGHSIFSIIMGESRVIVQDVWPFQDQSLPSAIFLGWILKLKSPIESIT